MLATALVAGGTGAAVALLVSHGGTGTNAPALPGAGGVGAGGPGGFDVASVAARVDRATLDITAVGPQIGQDAGTGMVLSSSGVVLTNNHVIEGSTTVTAQVDGAGRTYSATVLGTDPTADVALLQLQGPRSWPAVTVARGNGPQVGEAVVAIGNALDLPGPETVTTGTISSVGRSVAIAGPVTGDQQVLTGMLQTSAPISSGNSGGPLVDSRGDVVGMITAVATADSPGQAASDIGFAIPISTAISIARQIEAGEASASVHLGSPAATGMDLTSVACADGFDGCLPLGFGDFGEPAFDGQGIYQAPVGKGAVVADIEPGCPAAASGVEVGDVITAFNGHTVTTPDQVAAIVSALKVGQYVSARWVGQNGSHNGGRFQLVQGPNL